MDLVYLSLAYGCVLSFFIIVGTLANMKSNETVDFYQLTQEAIKGVFAVPLIFFVFVGPCFYALSWLMGIFTKATMGSDDLLYFLLIPSVFVIFFSFAIIYLSSGIYQNEAGDDDHVCAASAIFIFFAAFAVSNMIATDVRGDLSIGVAKFSAFLTGFLIANFVVTWLRRIIERYGFSDAYRTWSKFSWGVFCLAIAGVFLMNAFAGPYYFEKLGREENLGLISQSSIWIYHTMKHAELLVSQFF